MGKPRKKTPANQSPSVKSAGSIKKKYLSPGKPSRARRALLATEQDKVLTVEPGQSRPYSGSNLSTIVLENSVIKGYHAFKIKPPDTNPKTKLIVDREYTNITDRDACLVWIPALSEFDEKLHGMVTDQLRQLKLSDIAGLPIGHVPRVLASSFYTILDCGGEVYATTTDDPVRSFPPWPSPNEKGGGVVIPCNYTIVVDKLENTVQMLSDTLATMPEGSVMNIKVT